MNPHYFELTQMVIDAGFLAQFHDGWKRDGRMVCASRRDERGLTGVSFWLAERTGSWYLGMWGGEIFRFNDQSRVAASVIHFLADESILGYCLRVPDTERAEWNLTELTEAEANAVFPEDG